MSVRKTIHEWLDPARSATRISRAVDVVITTLILLSVIAVTIQTLPSLSTSQAQVLEAFQNLCVGVFSVEYVLRVWSAVEDQNFATKGLPRLRYSLTPLALVDLIAILPAWASWLGFGPTDATMLVLFRILRLAKLARYSSSMRLIGRVFAARRGELMASIGIMLGLLVLSSGLLYFAETRAQPEAFGSIPQSMWWAIATLTTVGYGDVTPITPLGRLFAAAVACFGIGLFALPTGVLGAAFVEETKRDVSKTCPNCGHALGSHPASTDEQR